MIDLQQSGAPAKIQASIVHRVPFHDLDPMQVVYHANYFNYFDLARTELFFNRGLDALGFLKRTGIVFPVVRSRAQYHHPLVWRDEFICTATLLTARHKLVIDFEICASEGALVYATGRTEQVAMHLKKRELLFSLPKVVVEALSS